MSNQIQSKKESLGQQNLKEKKIVHFYIFSSAHEKIINVCPKGDLHSHVLFVGSIQNMLVDPEIHFCTVGGLIN